MAIELSANEIVLLKKVLDSYLSELRLEIVETKHDKASLHEEEEVVKDSCKRYPSNNGTPTTLSSPFSRGALFCLLMQHELSANPQ